jgi:uncharacterized protein (DUF1501 family)
VSLAGETLGKIETDPASSEIAQKTVQAATYFDEKMDGLSQEWRETVWLNPPFSRTAEFLEKLHLEIDHGNVTSAIILVNANTSSGWWHQTLENSAAVLFCRGCVSF